MRKISSLDRRSGLYQITPEDAQKLLQAPGAKNRPLSLHRVRKYTNRMKNGLWKMTGEPIILNEAGELLDGEHRLRAITEYGKPVETVVTYGPFHFETMGQGAARGGRDALCLVFDEGKNYMFALSSIATLCMLHDRARERNQSPYSRGNETPTKAWTDIDNLERVKWAKKNPRALELLKQVYQLLGRDKALVSSSCLTAAWFMAERESSPEEAAVFFSPIITGAGLERDDIRMALRRSLTNRIATGMKRIGGLEAIHWLSKAWGLRGSKRTLFKVNANEPFPFFA